MGFEIVGLITVVVLLFSAGCGLIKENKAFGNKNKLIESKLILSGRFLHMGDNIKFLVMLNLITMSLVIGCIGDYNNAKSGENNSLSKVYGNFESFDQSLGGKCKEGLKAIEYSYYANRTGYEPEISRFPCAFTGPCPSIICISCGNGICETRIIEGNAIIGENYNNCPEDCVKPEMIKCKENDECGQNWCGQERNTCHQWIQVCNETGYCNKVHKEYSTYSCVDNKCIKN